MPDLIYGPSVGASLKWLPTNKTFYPGPAFWGSSTAPSDARTNSSTSGILAPPLHAETAMRIFYLAPLDTSMSTPVYTHEAMGFLCDVFPSLYKFHAYLLASRQRTNTSLLSLRHPWESMAAINPGWKSALASVKAAADFAQVISRLQVPTVTAQAFVAQAAVFYPASSHDEIIQDIYYPMLYLASCVGNNSTITSKCATTFDVVDIEFNTIFLRSAEALAEMATLLYQPVTKLGFSCPVPNKVEVQNLAAVVTTLSATLQSELWDPVDLIFKSNSHKYITGMLPLYATKLDESIQMGLISHILPTPNTFHYLCDVFPVSIYPCEESTMASGLATAAGPTPRIGLLIQNYLLYRGLIKNAMHGIARSLQVSFCDCIRHIVRPAAVVRALDVVVVLVGSDRVEHGASRRDDAAVTRHAAHRPRCDFDCHVHRVGGGHGCGRELCRVFRLLCRQAAARGARNDGATGFRTRGRCGGGESGANVRAVRTSRVAGQAILGGVSAL
ncbi:hypothetical protein, variant 8 [Aphanomyces astaci]|nr:hypothetical protein, variant 8 [Aphanomyces astaci]ETV89059.1 hypothetical protein, variant 8 [Aphanomyces astaci]|eukprot:XP_009821459.1 hypothetical protein, variant 8 [Aphanomyces astaci]